MGRLCYLLPAFLDLVPFGKNLFVAFRQSTQEVSWQTKSSELGGPFGANMCRVQLRAAQFTRCPALPRNSPNPTLGQNRWDPILGDWCTTNFRTYFSGDWDVYWGYEILTPGHIVLLCFSQGVTKFPPSKVAIQVKSSENEAWDPMSIIGSVWRRLDGRRGGFFDAEGVQDEADRIYFSSSFHVQPSGK